MRLYYHPASTTSRMIMLFGSEQGIDPDYKVVDLFTGNRISSTQLPAPRNMHKRAHLMREGYRRCFANVLRSNLIHASNS